MQCLQAGGLTVSTHLLDNEASHTYKDAITTTWKCKYQPVLPDMHHRNAAERAIQTFKAYFLAILAGVDATFLANHWDLLLPHTKLTLNLLHNSQTKPIISAWESPVHGRFNFDATPMGPPGCRVIEHAKPSTRHSWD